MKGLLINTLVMSMKVIRIEGKYEVIGYFVEGKLVRERMRITRDWR